MVSTSASRSFPNLDRRDFLRSSGFGLGALACPGLGRLTLEGSPEPAPKAKAVIQIFLQGGLTHIDTFDPKPDAPVEVRGELRTIRSKLDGEPLSNVLPKTAQIADKLCIIRSMTHGEAAHERGTHSMLTGYRPSPALIYPSMGSVISNQLGIRNNLPPYVVIPQAGETLLGTGYLSAAFGPFSVGGEPNSKDFRVNDLKDSMSTTRGERRRKLLTTIDEGFRGKADAIDATAQFYNSAYGLIDSKAAQQAFDISAEPAKMRDRYGRSNLGQRLLLARRLVQEGVRYVTVLDGGYDHHRNLTSALRTRMQGFDPGFSALIADLDSSGLLDEVMVMVTSEFGRTPRVNKTRGRDHWPRVFSTVIAGGGIKRGIIHGTSNAEGAEPETDPVLPPDLAATMFHLMGIDPETRLMAPGDRPVNIVRDGRVLKELLG